MQKELIETEFLKAPNVASVPQYSPFRYPGGKTWLYPFAKKWLLAHPQRKLVEPFAGGGYLSLMAAIEKLANEIIMVELDENVAAVWETILNGHSDWLIEQISNIDLTHKNVDEVLSRTNNSIRDRGFSTLLTNRIVRGGILAPGSGRIKYGENGKGIKSRWYPQTLVKRIKKITEAKDKISFRHADAFEVIEKYSGDKKALFFVDPPYPKAGRRLYTHHEINHDKLFETLSKVKGDFLLTYEDSAEIRLLANKFDFKFDRILMSTTHHRKKFELLISKEISWLR